MNIENKFASNSMEEMSHLPNCYYLDGSFRENDYAVGYCQVSENHICGPFSGPSEMDEQIRIKKTKVPEDFNHSL
jgi:hypothetical protein